MSDPFLAGCTMHGLYAASEKAIDYSTCLCAAGVKRLLAVPARNSVFRRRVASLRPAAAAPNNWSRPRPASLTRIALHETYVARNVAGIYIYGLNSAA